MLYVNWLTAVKVKNNLTQCNFFGTQFEFQIMFNAAVRITCLFFKAYHMYLIYLRKLEFGENRKGVEWDLWKSDQICFFKSASFTLKWSFPSIILSFISIFLCYIFRWSLNQIIFFQLHCITWPQTFPVSFVWLGLQVLRHNVHVCEATSSRQNDSLSDVLWFCPWSCLQDHHILPSEIMFSEGKKKILFSWILSDFKMLTIKI